jgi:hypothetical protein
MLDPVLNFRELYMDGRIEVTKARSLMVSCSPPRMYGGRTVPSGSACCNIAALHCTALLRLSHPNCLLRATRHAAHHFDLDAHFHTRFLDSGLRRRGEITISPLIAQMKRDEAQARAILQALSADRSHSACVAKFRLPARGAFRNEIKEVPDTAEIVTRAEAGIRHPHDLVALALEDRNARHRAAIRAIAEKACSFASGAREMATNVTSR